MNISRRNFLKSGSLALSALGLNMASPIMFQRKLMAASGLANKKMIFIFQEGGNDGVNTVIPR
ncbi:twin-arginine translocation pathway signal, partial [bacterium]|nr:twin-arginine translocation pathway signal [bacterium]